MGVLAPTQEEKKEVINKVKEELLIEGEDKFEREDLEDLETDEENLRRFWIHALHLGGDRIEDTVSLIVKTLLWRKEFGVKDLCKEKISKVALDRGEVVLGGRDKEGCRILIIKVKNHVKDPVNRDDDRKNFVMILENLQKEEKGKMISIVFDCEGAGIG